MERSSQKEATKLLATVLWMLVSAPFSSQGLAPSLCEPGELHRGTKDGCKREAESFSKCLHSAFPASSQKQERITNRDIPNSKQQYFFAYFWQTAKVFFKVTFSLSSCLIVNLFPPLLSCKTFSFTIWKAILVSGEIFANRDKILSPLLALRK